MINEKPLENVVAAATRRYLGVTLSALALVGLSAPLLAQDDGLTELEPPPLPSQLESGEVMEPDITIVDRQDETIVEYRVAGRLRAIKVIPKNDAFPPYYLSDADGDGRLETRYTGLEPDFMVNMWTLFSWD